MLEFLIFKNIFKYLTQKLLNKKVRKLKTC